jgi:hypothetical protein
MGNTLKHAAGPCSHNSFRQLLLLLTDFFSQSVVSVSELVSSYFFFYTGAPLSP